MKHGVRRSLNRSASVSVTTLYILLCSFASAALAAPHSAKDKNPRPKSGFVTSWDGAKIHYIEAGRSKTPVGNAEVGNPLPPSVTITKGNISVTGPHQFPSILFVPGWTMPGWIWENQIAHFSADYRVVAMDPRAQGDSSKTCSGSYPASHARDIKAVIDQLHLAPVVVVGWSMAVTEIASYVDQFGTNGIAGLVLVDGVTSFVKFVGRDDQTVDRLSERLGGAEPERRFGAAVPVQNPGIGRKSQKCIWRLVYE